MTYIRRLIEPLLIEATKQLRAQTPQLEFRLLLIGGDSPMSGAEPQEAELRRQADRWALRCASWAYRNTRSRG